MSDATPALSQIERGDPSAAEQLLVLVYDELRRLAAHKLAHERPGQTLQATALVHEAYLRLVDVNVTQNWNSRGHFFAAAAEAMRRILIESARRKRRRNGTAHCADEWEYAEVATIVPPDELLALDDAIDALAKQDSSAAELVKLRYFAGLSVEQAGELLGLPRTSAYRHWTYARAWLYDHLES